MMKIDNIYVRITAYLLHLINTNWCRINTQHFMLDHPFSTEFKFSFINEKDCQYFCYQMVSI